MGDTGCVAGLPALLPAPHRAQREDKDVPAHSVPRTVSSTGRTRAGPRAAITTYRGTFRAWEAVGSLWTLGTL